MSDPTELPVIDLFAGPGGLGEGFGALEHPTVKFTIALSVEMERDAHSTLRLRSFYRQFDPGGVPEDYYSYVRGESDQAQLGATWPREWEAAERAALHCTVAENTLSELSDRIHDLVPAGGEWVLIGGPPCQAYSLVGRARRAHEDRELFERDQRQRLYEYYLRILSRHRPMAFVMENVQGLLSARLAGQRLFAKIHEDLQRPRAEMGEDGGVRYRLFSLSPLERRADDDPSRYVLRSEFHGVPQRRHRVIIMGIRSDIGVRPPVLQVNRGLPIQSVIGDLPRIRSGVSLGGGRADESPDAFLQAIRIAMHQRGQGMEVARQGIETALAHLDDMADAGGLPPFARGFSAVYDPEARAFGRDLASWLLDERLGGVANHESRSHMAPDLARYFFAAAFAVAEQRSPKLADLPDGLIPAHASAEAGRGTVFTDRFRVQSRDQVATTVTSHIAKDGHYYIHYDPEQCRSLTVREAARLQTFPDNYFFEGKRTQQYVQVGNAVPPLLATQIARSLADALSGEK